MSLIETNFDKAITIERYQGDSAYGPQYEDPETVEGMVEQEKSWTRNQEGDVVVSEATLYLSPDISPPPVQSKITFDGSEHFILSVREPEDRLIGKRHHIECDLT